MTTAPAVRILAALLLALLSALMPARAQLLGGGGTGLLGLCTTRFTEVSTNGNPSYLPFSTSEVVSPIRMKVSATLGCGNLSLTFRSQQGGKLVGTTGFLSYQVRLANGRVLRLDGIVGELLSALLSPLLGSTYEVFVVVPPGQVVRAGAYTDRLLIELWNGATRLDQRDVPLQVNVQAQARLSVEGSATGGFTSSGSGAVDFGVMATGRVRSTYLFINSNANCAVQMRSANASELRRVGGNSQREIVPYTVTVGGTPVSLRTPASLPSPLSSTSFLRSLEMRLTLGQVDWQVAGSYRDTITVDLVITE